MSDARPLLVTESQARQIGDLIRGAGVTSAGVAEPAAAAAGVSLVVQLKTAIAAGSTAQVDAEIYDLIGSTWTPTKQIIKVRSATGTAVSTTGRRIARQVSRFGWCVVET